MSITKIWKCKTRLDTLINYVVNEEKTVGKRYVSGINCMVENAYNDMRNTQKEFFKSKG